MSLRINIHNYEAYLLDLFEGTISSENKLLLEQFLLEHPELDSDIDELPLLKQPAIKLTDKSSLRKELATDDFIAYHEAILSNEEEREVLNQIKRSKESNAEFQLISKLKLNPRPVLYPNKEGLKRERVIPLWKSGVYVVTSVAAIFLIYFSLLKPEAIYTPKELSLSIFIDDAGDDSIDSLFSISNKKSPIFESQLIVEAPVVKQQIKDSVYTPMDLIQEIQLAEQIPTKDTTTVKEETSDENLSLITEENNLTESTLKINLKNSALEREKKVARKINTLVAPKKTEYLASTNETSDRYSLKLGKFKLTRISSK